MVFWLEDIFEEMAVSFTTNQKSVPPKSFGTRDVTITLDRTRHQARPLLLVISRLVIDAGGSVTQSTESCHSREPRIVVELRAS